MLARLIVIGFGLAIIFPTLVYHGVASIYPAPKREDFFPRIEASLPATASTEERQARAELQQQRQSRYDEAQRRFSFVLLVAATVLGVLAIFGGSAVPIPAIAAGVMLGGIFAIGVGYWVYSYAPSDWWRFGSLFAGFLSLLLVGYRQQRRESA